MRRLPVIGLCLLIAVAAAIASVSTVSLLPPRVEPRALDVAVAKTRVLVERPRPLIRDWRATTGDYESAQKRAVLIGGLMTTRPVLAAIARRAGVAARDIAATTPVTAGVQSVFNEPDSERRADQIVGATKPYRLEVRPSQTLPTLDVYTQAPTVAAARRLADAVVPGTRDHLLSLARSKGADPARQMTLDQLGASRGAIVNGQTAVRIALLTFGFVLVVGLLVALAVARLRRSRLRADGDVPVPTPAMARSAVSRAGDWPRTTRALPWMIAALMAVVWLLPFNDIMLDASLPIDLYLDRLILPLVIAVWLVVVAAAGRDAARLRMTWIHVAIGVFVGVACLSLVIEARAINQMLQFDLAFKKFALLISFVSLFVVVSSSLRRSEIRAFMTYTLLLAAVCAVGTLVEFRFEFNVFYWAANAVLPGAFLIGNVDPTGLDEIGRREVRGPGQASLELVAMLAMALPIAVARLLHSKETRARALYVAATVVLVAGCVATFRKSAFLAPISVCLTLLYFRRRDLVRLAPLAIVMVLVVQVLAPGAITGVAGQFDSGSLGVTTVSDRTADYDAIRPDVFSHLVIGRGYGSYDPQSYRLLDMELLRQLIEGGVIGLLAYLMMAVAVVGVARRPIRSGDHDDAVTGLAAAAAAVCFVTVSVLFDVMSFPHVPYIFLWMAALLAIVSREPRTVAPAPAPVEAPARPRTAPPTLEPAWRS